MKSGLLLSAIVMGVPVWVAAQDAATPATAPAGQTADANDPFRTHAPGEPTERIKADALLRLSVVDEMLLTETTVRPGGPQLLAIEGLTDPVSATIRHRKSDPGDRYVPDAIDMSVTHRDGDRTLTTSLQTAPGHVNFARSIESPGSEYLIQFIQSVATASEPARATLYVQALQDPEKKVTLIAPSFASFARTYPDELTRNVRPMLESFGPQASLFVVGDELGSLVFPEAYRGDEATRQRISALVAQLADESFARRKQAGEELEKLGTKAATELATLDRSKLDAEQLARIDTILSKVRPAFPVDVTKLRGDVGFLLDCMMSPTPQLRMAAMEQLQKATGRTIALADAADQEQRVQQVYKLRVELLPASPATMPAKKNQ